VIRDDHREVWSGPRRYDDAAMGLGGDRIDPDESPDLDAEEDVWPFPSETFLAEWAPGMIQAQNAWMASIDSLRAPDRKTHELIRMVCAVIARQPGTVLRHARLAAEVGATWDEIAGSILLTQPAFGIEPAIQAMPAARRGFRQGAAQLAADADDEDSPDD
jgi:alkylhydroperoxidase/carboxymuconolactone decarboxylase family protein YurZ